jgi:hypothetical protein
MRHLQNRRHDEVSEYTENNLTVFGSGLRTNDKTQATETAGFRHEPVKTGFHDPNLAGIQRSDLRCVDVPTYDLVTQMRETGSGR